MYKNDLMYISEHYTKEEYLRLELDSENIDEDKLRKAVMIFEDRIKGRFLDQINILSGNDNSIIQQDSNFAKIYKNGFSIMALECLLIETFQQFHDGLNDNNRCSSDNYCEFLSEAFPEVFGNDEKKTVARSFYTNIRCGILHQAQTKGKHALTVGNDEPVKIVSGVLFVSVDKIIEMVNRYFERYCGILNSRTNTKEEKDLKVNFIKKMDFICKK